MTAIVSQKLSDLSRFTVIMATFYADRRCMLNARQGMKNLQRVQGKIEFRMIEWGRSSALFSVKKELVSTARRPSTAIIMALRVAAYIVECVEIKSLPVFSRQSRYWIMKYGRRTGCSLAKLAMNLYLHQQQQATATNQNFGNCDNNFQLPHVNYHGYRQLLPAMAYEISSSAFKKITGSKN